MSIPIPEGQGLLPHERTDEPHRTFAALAERRFSATSADGIASVTVSGDQQVQTVEVIRTDAPAGLVGRAVVQALKDALEQAGRAGVEAMASLPGMPAEMRVTIEGLK